MRANNIEMQVRDLSRTLQTKYYQEIYKKTNIRFFEKERKRYLFYLIFAVPLTSIIFLGLVLLSQNLYEALVVLIVGLSLVILVYNNISKSFAAKFKNTYYDCIAETVGLKWLQGDFEYTYSSSIQKSKLFSAKVCMREDDIFYGNYNGVKLKIAEADIADRAFCTGDKKTETLVPKQFHGVFGFFDANKKIESTTIVKPKLDFELSCSKLVVMMFILLVAAAAAAVLGFGIKSMISGGFSLPVSLWILGGLGIFAFACWQFMDILVLKELRFRRNFQRVNLEDTEFNKLYQAYSYDQVEGRYLLTTAFIDRFLHVGKVFKTNRRRCSFAQNKLILAIPANRNMFELGSLFSPVTNSKKISRFYDEIASLLILIDYFKLDNKTNL